MANIDKICEYNSRNVNGAFASDYKEKLTRAVNSPIDLMPPITMNDIKDTLAYTGNTKMFRPNLHIGQRKLAVEEVQFLTKVLQKYSALKYVIYAGAAPSIHMSYVVKLFPALKFLLIDPAEFKISGDITTTADIDEVGLVDRFVNNASNITTYRGFFTELIARQCSRIDNYVFISDIRTCTDLNATPYDYDVLHNLASQFVWLNEMAAGNSPLSYMLKYRAPFYELLDINDKLLDAPDHILDRAKEQGIDFAADYRAKKINYLAGEYYIQSWAGFTSSETRLCYFRSDLKIVPHMSAAEYENKMFYYNAIQRGFQVHANKHALTYIGFDHCADCAREAHIWDEYNKLTGCNLLVIKHVKALTKCIGKRQLLADKCAHGYCYGNRAAWLNKLNSMLNNYGDFMQDQVIKKQRRYKK